jgi:hypothetical protein
MNIVCNHHVSSSLEQPQRSAACLSCCIADCQSADAGKHERIPNFTSTKTPIMERRFSIGLTLTTEPTALPRQRRPPTSLRIQTATRSAACLSCCIADCQSADAGKHERIPNFTSTKAPIMERRFSIGLTLTTEPTALPRQRRPPTSLRIQTATRSAACLSCCIADCQSANRLKHTVTAGIADPFQ